MILALARVEPFVFRHAARHGGAGRALSVLAAFAPGAMAAQTIVSLTFDDGIDTQNFARTQMTAHGMHGTFYINSGDIGTDPYYMDWSDAPMP